ncbi:MAG: hypothetical protein M0Q38_17570 [Bacteroidales bacterium]|jgi:hypothetical protein|nr:hypothetical protein [Bacteroidales bacterium]
MRCFFPFFLLVFSGLYLKGQTSQEGDEGAVSFITSQNIYIKFQSTKNIKKGDTLFIRMEDKTIPALVVKDLSSVSCVCIPVSGAKLNVSDKVFTGKYSTAAPGAEATTPQQAPAPPVQQSDSLPSPKTLPKKKLQQIHGYLSIASYTNFSDNSATNSQRMKYTFSLLAKNIGESKLSAECYISFLHSNKTWGEIQNNLFNGLKIYNLNLNYDFSKNFSLLLGRKINPKLSNMGANDGLQLEMRFKPITVGIIAGFRPNYSDYGFNVNLFQAGGYLYNQFAGKNGDMQTTLAFVQQMNSWKTDRRFAYLQHVNSLVKNLTFFGSVELDLYRLNFNPQDSTYTPRNNPRQLTLCFSYSALQNIIYYETYKSYLDKLLDPATLQGYMFQIICRPVNKLAVGITTSYRFEKNDPKDTKNLYGYITYSQIPGINVSATASVTLLETSYIGGNIYGIGLSRDLASGKLYLGLNYRYVNYRYYGFETTSLPQNVGEFNLTWRIYKRISMSLYYEGTFENTNQYNRIYAQLHLGF